jgi:DNA-binding LacI/PurR family transcriptional regulator
MEGELPGAQIVFNFIPPDGNLEIIQRLVADSLQAPMPEGFVLVRCPLAVQRLIQSSGLPAVIYGQPYPSITGIPSIDYDHEQSTEMLVKYLLDKGCERIVLFLRQQVFPGDHRVVDQMQRLLTAAGLGLGDWVLRCLPQDEACVAAETVRLLKAASGRPTGFFCRSEPLADGVAAGVARLGDTGPKAVICAWHVYRRSGGAAWPRYVHTRPVLSPEQIGHRIGQKLALQARGLRPDPYQEALAMELAQPGPIQQPPTHPARPWNDPSQPTEGSGAW